MSIGLSEIKINRLIAAISIVVLQQIVTTMYQPQPVATIVQFNNQAPPQPAPVIQIMQQQQPSYPPLVPMMVQQAPEPKKDENRETYNRTYVSLTVEFRVMRL